MKISPYSGLRKGRMQCDQTRRKVEYLCRISLMREMDIFNLLMKSIQEPKWRTQRSVSMYISYLSMVSQKWKFLIQQKAAAKISEAEYPREDGWKIALAAMADDALDIPKINISPGGKQRAMSVDGGMKSLRWWTIPLEFWKKANYTAGVNIRGWTSIKMREILASHPDKKKKKIFDWMLLSGRKGPHCILAFNVENEVCMKYTQRRSVLTIIASMTGWL